MKVPQPPPPPHSFSCLGCVTAQVAVYAPAPVTREPGSESSTCFAGAYSPWPPPFAPPTPLRPPLQTPPQGAFLALFVGFTATMTRSDFSCPHHRLRLLTFPMRTVPLTQHLTARPETSQVPMRSLCT